MSASNATPSVSFDVSAVIYHCLMDANSSFCMHRFSIHAKKTEKGEVNSVQSTFPIPVEGVEGVYHCGFHDASSFGSTSYLLVRSEGNILIDSPRFNPVLARKIEALGGIKWIFLTHK